MGRALAIILAFWVGTAEAANVHPTPVATATPQPTATPANTPVPTATVVPTATPGSGGGVSNAVSVTNNANISIATATDTALTFNTENYDYGAMHDTGSNTSRLTVPTSGGGVYLAECYIRFAANATGTRQVSLAVNGAVKEFVERIPGIVASNAPVLGITRFFSLAAGDYVECLAYQTSGGNLDVTGNTAYSPQFSLSQIQSH